MKKTLVALAALASMSAFAQSSVTLYGIADVWLGNLKKTTEIGGVTTGVAQNLLNSGGINGSRWGLKGSEDLGGGLKANFLLESGFNIDNGSSAQGGVLFGRQAVVGLSGGFGELRFGRQYTAYDELRGGTDLMGHSSFSATVGSAGGAWALGRDYTFRADNTIRYATPNFGGFGVGATYSFGENKTTTTGASGIIAIHGLYANGPITAGIGYQQEKNPGGLAAGPAAPNPNFNNGGFAVNGTTETHLLVSGAYDFGVAKVRLAYNTSKDNAAGTPSADKEFTVGVSAPLGPVTIASEFATSKNSAVKGRSLGVQAQYDLSKRTFAYVGFQNTKSNDIVAAGAASTTTKGNLIAVGVRHGF